MGRSPGVIRCFCALQAAGFMVLPSGGHDDLADLGDVVATVTENISEGNTKLTLPGKWDVTP
jgi:hypothetical protein